MSALGVVKGHLEQSEGEQPTATPSGAKAATAAQKDVAKSPEGEQEVITCVGSELRVKREVAAAVAEDKVCRHPGVTTGVYTLAQLAPFCRLGQGVPIIRGKARRPFRRAATDAKFRARLKTVAPFLESLDLQRLGLRLAGGAASAILLNTAKYLEAGSSYTFHDYDLFLVGHESDLLAKTAIMRLGEHLRKCWNHVEVYRTQNCITFYTPDASTSPDHVAGRAIVQVILRRYSTEAEIVHGFDMGSSAVMWNGHQVVVTALGKLAVEHGVNVLNLAARRASYEQRLARYFGRGFDLVLPDLDGAALIANRGRLPYLFAHLVTHYDAGSECSCHLKAFSLHATRPGFDNVGSRLTEPSAVVFGSQPDEMSESDYGFGQVAYGRQDVVAARNVRALNDGKMETLCAFGVYEKDTDIFALNTFFDREVLIVAVESCFQANGDAKVVQLRGLLGADGAANLILELITEGRKPDRRTISLLCEQRLARLAPKANIPFVFMTVEDKTALTGPFTRDVVTTKEWYGVAHHGL
jgi:hypothetical protein